MGQATGDPVAKAAVVPDDSDDEPAAPVAKAAPTAPAASANAESASRAQDILSMIRNRQKQ